MFLLKLDNEQTTIQISEKMGLERTTVQKALKNLLDRKLVKRIQRNLKRGGYVFMYRVDKKDEIKERLKEIIYGWYKSAANEIDSW